MNIATETEKPPADYTHPETRMDKYRGLKKAYEQKLAAPSADRETLTREFAQELQRRDPDLAADIKRWARDGIFLSVAIDSAVESALKRGDLAESEKDHIVREDLKVITATLGTIQKSKKLTDGLIPYEIVLEFAWSVLWVGLQAGLDPKEIENLRARLASEKQRSAAKGSTKARRAKAEVWKSFAAAEAKRIRGVNRTLSKKALAARIEYAWSGETFGKVGRESLMKYIGSLERKELIPKRSS
jgi:hypothetical protein